MINFKIALVTGGSSGIGKAFVERLAHSGFRVVTIARESGHYTDCLKHWENNQNIIQFTGDITGDDDIRNLAGKLEEDFGRLDLLINNAGVYITDDGGFPEMEVFYRNLEVNAVAPYRLIFHCLPLMERAESPIIINITSGAGSFGSLNSRGPLAYRVSKAAANMLTKSLSYELREKNIAIHAADPGWVKTRLNPGGTDTPENAVEGMWHLTELHDMEMSGKFWFWGREIPW